jgi:hypothetical protein
MILLAVVSSSAAAEWVKVSVSAAGNTYVDTATILKAGDKVKMWKLMDYKIVADPNSPYKSVKRQYEYDCKGKLRRLLFASSFSDRMGKGEILTTVDEPANWMPIVRGSVGEILWKVACGKRGKQV